MENSKLHLILASSSPRRKELLGHLKTPFEIMTKNVPEESSHRDPAEFCREIAQLKGAAVSRDLLSTAPQKSFYVVSADTIVSLGGMVYGKPTSAQEARSFLSELSGKTHSVFTAVSLRLLRNGMEVEHSFVDESKVTFDEITADLMDLYVATGDSLDKAGAYGIQGPSLTFISSVNGSYSTVVGFPLSRFITESSRFLKEQFPHEASWLKLFQS